MDLSFELSFGLALEFSCFLALPYLQAFLHWEGPPVMGGITLCDMIMFVLATPVQVNGNPPLSIFFIHLFSHPIYLYYLRPTSPISLRSVSQIQGHMSGTFPPPSYYCCGCLDYIARKAQVFTASPTRVESGIHTLLGANLLPGISQY